MTPYDQQVKLLLEEDPRAALQVLIGLPADGEIEVELLEREIVVGTKVADQPLRITRRRESYIEHIEAATEYRNIDLEATYQRASLLEIKHNLGVRTRLLLMTDRRLPRRPLRQYVVEKPHGNARHEFQVEYIRPSQIPARRILALGMGPLLPWVALANTSVEEEAEALMRLLHDPGLAARHAMLFGLRYHGKEGSQRMETLKAASKEAAENMEWLLKNSWMFQDYRRGERQGITKGLTRGRQQGAAHVLTLQLQEKFGRLPASAKAKIRRATEEQIELWSKRILRAKSLEAVWE